MVNTADQCTVYKRLSRFPASLIDYLLDSPSNKTSHIYDGNDLTTTEQTDHKLSIDTATHAVQEVFDWLDSQGFHVENTSPARVHHAIYLTQHGM